MSAARASDIDFSRVAHDLRGPLMPLRTAAWLLRNEHGEAPGIKELAEIVDRQSARLARMMDELADWGRSASDQATLNLVPVDISLAVDMAVGGVPYVNVEGADTAEVAGFPLRADPRRLGQLLATLLEFAASRDPESTPQLFLSVASGKLNIRIRDHGPTLEAMERASLFSQPQQRPYDDGLGLRLMMARLIAEAHGGSLAIDADSQNGLTISCVLPPLDCT
jgi:K+-sensing histidine kinase KdpD